MEALTVAELRSLAKLHRAGIDGATERLQLIVRDERDALPALLSFPAKNLERLLGEEDPVALLVATIERAPRVARAARARLENERAQHIASELARKLVLDDRGDCELRVGALASIAKLGDHRHIVFGERGGVPTRRLRDLLHACRRVTACSVFVRTTTLDVIYKTPRSRGIVRLHLSFPAPHEHTIVVAMPDPAPVVETATCAVPSCVTLAETPAAGSGSARSARRRSPREHRSMPSFGRYIFDALLAVALGGGP